MAQINLQASSIYYNSATVIAQLVFAFLKNAINKGTIAELTTNQKAKFYLFSALFIESGKHR